MFVLLCWALLLLVSLTAIGSFEIQLHNVHMLTQVQIPAKDANDQVLQAMTDAQNGLIAYETSGDRALLQPYFGAHARTLTALATLREKLTEGSEGEADTARHEALGGREALAAQQWWADALRVEQDLSRGESPDAFQGRALFDRFLAANATLEQYLTAEREEYRLAAETMLSRGEAVTIVAALLSLVAMLVRGRGVARSISRPLTDLRDAVVRQREGEPGVRASEDQGSTELRSLARNFNALTDQNLALHQAQTRALSGHQITTKIGRAIGAASDTQQALDVMCAALGEGLGADRVISHTLGADLVMSLGAQWHRPDLPPVRDLAELPDMGELAEVLWLSAESRVRDDLMVAETQAEERVRDFCRVTGARASVIVPIGYGDRLIGMIYVLMVGEPRAWTASETGVVQAVAGFVARAIMEAEHQEHQREYVERVQRLDQQKSDFLATVSHELRTPLTSITGYLELLEEGDVGELTEQQHGMLEVISRSAGRLRSLIEDVMMLSRIEGGANRDKFVPVSIRALITRAGEELWLLAQSSAVELEIDAGPKAAIVLGDRTSLDRAVINILTNAIKFSRPGNVVTITSTLDQEARRVLITCQDHGVGIPSRDQGELFTRFFRASNATDQSIPGVGLGLSIVKQIVEDHHDGQLRLISVEGEGTTVVIDLPLCQLSQAPAADGNDSQSGGVSTNTPDLAH
jgi:signal transduction histidine kinase/CHASE3 domain sensor protein